MTTRAVRTPNAPQPLAHFSQGVISGDHLFIAGLGPRDPKTGKVVPGTIEEQIDLTFQNLKAIVEAAGSSMSKVVRCVCYLQTRDHFAQLNEAWNRHFGNFETPPCRAVMFVPQFGLEGMLFEIIPTARL